MQMMKDGENDGRILVTLKEKTQQLEQFSTLNIH